jgi:hypothetical protein
MWLCVLCSLQPSANKKSVIISPIIKMDCTLLDVIGQKWCAMWPSGSRIVHEAPLHITRECHHGGAARLVKFSSQLNAIYQ